MSATVIDRDTAPATTELSRAVEQTGLTGGTADLIVNSFGPHFIAMREALGESSSIVVTNVAQKAQMAAAGISRKKIAKIRTALEKTRVEIKAVPKLLSEGIDNVARKFRLAMEAEEARLELAERFAERVEAERKAKAKADREAEIAPFGFDVRITDLGQMDDGAYATLLAREKASHEARVAKAESDRVIAEQAERDRQEALAKERAENARIKAQADKDLAELRAQQAEKDRLAKIESDRIAEENRVQREKDEAERKRIQAELDAANAEKRRVEQAAREERERIEAAARAEQKAREDAEAEELRKAQALAAAPDVNKLNMLAQALRDFELPTVGEKSARVVETARTNLVKLAAWIDAQAEIISGGEK